jgi:pentatricopeptide repeat protein
MYAKCSVQTKAQEVFDTIPVANISSWTALLAGYAQRGQSKVVFMLFCKMMAAGIDPDVVTYLVLLNACSHAGLIEEGQIVFDSLSSTCSLTPTVEHYACMVDLFGRAGHFDKAMNVIKKVPSYLDHRPLWFALLGSCPKWGNVETARFTFKQLQLLDEHSAAAYTCMGNVYM